MEQKPKRPQKRARARRRPEAPPWKTVALILPLFLLPAIWRWTPLNEWVNLATIIGWQDSVRNNPAAPYLVAGAYVAGGLVLFPVTILTVATVFTFGPLWGNVYGFVGWILSAALGYGLGRLAGHDLLHKLATAHMDRLIRQATRHGFLTVLTMRILPVAPFTIVNLFVGASEIKLRDFLLASSVGRLPGMIALSLVGFRLEGLLHNPAMENLVALAIVAVLVVVAVIWVARRFRSAAAEPRPGRLASQKNRG